MSAMKCNMINDIEKKERRPRYHQIVLAKTQKDKLKNLIKLTSSHGVRNKEYLFLALH